MEKYAAFVSYSHADVAWATWIHSALERYRIPRRLAREFNLERKPRPIFRDRDELASSGDLSTKLLQALEDSSALIIVCSPAAAQSHWVNKEIEHFISLGRGNRIFCLVVDGESGASFPPAITNRLGFEPIAADPRADGDGRQNAKLKLIAGMLDIGFDTVRQRDKQWRRRVLSIQAAALAASAVVASSVVYLVVRTPPCMNAGELIPLVWSQSHQDAIETAFDRTGTPYANDSWANVKSILTRYITDWASMHEETCVATKVRREQSQRLMDLRMACLNERRTQFVSLRQSFELADNALAENALSGTARLKPLARCADRASLEAAFPPPENPAIRKQVDLAYSSIADTQNMLDGGRFNEALDVALPLVDSVRPYQYPPVEAEALLLLGEAYVKSGDMAAAKDVYFEAAARAAAANDPELAAESWLALPHLLSKSGETEDAFRMLRFAQTYVEQLPENHRLRAEFHRANGTALTTSGQVKEGIVENRLAVRLIRELDGQDLAKYLGALSWALVADFQMDEATLLAQEAGKIALDMYGNQHPKYSESLGELASIQSKKGSFAEAARLIREALDIVEAVYSPTHPKRAGLLIDLGWQLISLGELERSVEVAQRAIDILDQQEDTPWPALGAANNVAGDAYLSNGEYSSARIHLEATLHAWRQADNQPAIGIALNNLGNLSNREGRFDLAQESCQEALLLDQSRLRENHPDLAYPLSCLGEAYIGLGDLGKATEVLERAHTARNQENVAAGALAWSRWLLGRVLWESKTDRRRAVEYLTFANNKFTEMGDGAKSERDDMEIWLQQNDVELSPLNE